jgi:hypothetical protein
MGDLWRRVLPLAIGAGANPTILIANLVILGLPARRLARSTVFVLGNVVVLALFTVVVIGGLFPTITFLNQGDDPTEAAFDLVAAVALVALAIREILHRPDPAAPKKQRRMPQGPLPEFFVFGMVMMATNVSTLVIYFPAAKDISVATVSTGDKVLVTAVLFVIASAMVWAPTLFSAVAPTTSVRVLDRVKGFVTSRERLLTIAVLVLYAAYLTYRGLTRI